MTGFSNLGIFGTNSIKPRVNLPTHSQVASSDVRFYFNANDRNSTIYQDGGANYVSRIDDNLGGDNYLYQDTLSVQPQINSDYLNGKRIVTFADAPYLRSNIELDVTLGQDFTLGILTKNNTRSSDVLINQWDFANNYREWRLGGDQTGRCEIRAYTTNGVVDKVSTGAFIDSWHYWTMSYDSSLNKLRITIDTNYSETLQNISPEGQSGLGAYIGANEGLSSATKWNGYIAEMTIWDKNLSLTEVTNQVNIINSYWSLSL